MVFEAQDIDDGERQTDEVEKEAVAVAVVEADDRSTHAGNVGKGENEEDTAHGQSAQSSPSHAETAASRWGSPVTLATSDAESFAGGGCRHQFSGGLRLRLTK